LMVLGSNLVQNPNSDLLVSLVFSIPVGILIALVLFINCFQDYNADKSVNKNSWVVRLAGPNSKANYRKPFKVWRIAMIIAFLIIGIASAFFNPLASIALLPIFLFHFANKKGLSWLLEWEKDNADLQKLPYELLIVNVSTIGIHFLTGLLLSLGFIIRSLWI
jgi:1,4-dihydroxy-2-naphthoate octaprenyltransferase